MAEITKELGRIPVSRGDYQINVEYYKDNIVQYKRGSYQVISESPITNIPPTDDNNVVNYGWKLFAGTLDAQDVVNQVKNQEAKSIQAIADREAEILIKSDAALISSTTVGLEGSNIQDNLNDAGEKLSELETQVIYDVTANNDGATFASLSELLSSENLSILIPTSVRHGGMSIRFVQSSDNKYVQLHYMGTDVTGTPNPFLDTVNWQSEQVDSVPVKMSKNLAESGGIERSIEESVGLSIDLSRGYYDSSGNIIDGPVYGHTNVLEENFIRENWNITPNSLIVWNNNVITRRYWEQREQIKKFDHIAYNFQTTKSNAVCIRTSYLYNREQYISEAVAKHESDIILLNSKLGTSFILTQGYYNKSGIIVDSVGYGHTDILNESVVRTNWSITPNSVAAWKDSTFKFQYWSNIEKIGKFDKISYNFQTTKRSVYNLTPTILSDKAVTLETKIGNTPLNTSAETITGAINELNSYVKNGVMDFTGKKVAIIGDSISTNGDLTAQNPYGNVPEIIIQSEDIGVTLQAYPTYYDIGVTVGGHEIVSSDIGTELTFVPIAEDVGKMVGKPLSYNPPSTIVWWEILQQQLGIVPIPVCWSG